jgi:competence protein ComEA
VLRIALLGICLAGSAQSPVSNTHGVPATSSRAPTPPSSLVDINRASLEELMKVPGITRVWADRIIRFRPYRTKADLDEQGVIPADLYSRIKDSIIAHRMKQ